jgi:hypothetical protein
MQVQFFMTLSFQGWYETHLHIVIKGGELDHIAILIGDVACCAMMMNAATSSMAPSRA